MSGTHITEKQVRLYMKFRKDFTQEVAASKANISVSSARRIENGRHQPKKAHRHWRTRPDPLEAVWESIVVLEQLKAERGLPTQLSMDNGPELISATLTDWCETNNIELVYIQPGKPQQNGFVERVNGSFRREFLDAYLFENLSQVRDMAWFWRLDYNEERTHESLGNLPPATYRGKLENSSPALSH